MMRGIDHAEHLSLDRSSRNWKMKKLPSPGAGTIHDGAAWIDCLVGLHPSDAALRQKQLGHGCTRRNINSSVPGGFERRRDQCTRIHASFLQEECQPQVVG